MLNEEQLITISKQLQLVAYVASTELQSENKRFEPEAYPHIELAVNNANANITRLVTELSVYMSMFSAKLEEWKGNGTAANSDASREDGDTSSSEAVEPAGKVSPKGRKSKRVTRQRKKPSPSSGDT